VVFYVLARLGFQIFFGASDRQRKLFARHEGRGQPKISIRNSFQLLKDLAAGGVDLMCQVESIMVQPLGSDLSFVQDGYLAYLRGCWVGILRCATDTLCKYVYYPVAHCDCH